jgi:hypothetical protein
MAQLLEGATGPKGRKDDSGTHRVLRGMSDYLRQMIGTQAGDTAKEFDGVEIMKSSGMTPEPWQVAYLGSTAQDELLCCARGSGKTSCVAARLLTNMLNRPGYQCLVFAPTQRQSDQLLTYVRGLWEGIGCPIKTSKDRERTFALVNGSWVQSLPDNQEGVRGPHVNELVLDEGAQISDALYKSVRAMLLVKRGRLVGLSTPFGKRGWFWEAWEKDDDWQKVRITGPECGRYTAEQLARERRKIGDYWFEQEYMLVFHDAEGVAIPERLISAALDDTVEPIFPGFGFGKNRRFDD